MTELTEMQRAEPQETVHATLWDIDSPDRLAGIYVSLNEAARQTGIAKGTISKDAKDSSKLQWHEQPDGTRKLHAAQVFQFYENRIKKRNLVSGNIEKHASLTETQRAETEREQQDRTAETIKLVLFEERLKANEQLIKTLQERNEDLKAERDHWREHAESLKLLVRPPAAPEPVSSPAERKPFWRRLFP